MANENLDTTNKLIKPEDISPSDDAIIRQLSDNLQDITPEDVDAMCDEMDEAEKRKNEEEREKGEIPQELKDFREKWKQKIDLDEDKKKAIINAVKEIPVKVEKDNDGSRLIEFKLGNKIRKILDPKLCNHTDFEYCNNWEDKNKVKLGGMRGDGLGLWKNEKLRDYVEGKKKEGLFIPLFETINILLSELGSMADLKNEGDQIAMLMYLTGLDGCYWLAMEGGISRYRILFSYKARYHCSGVDEHEHNNLLLMHYDF